MGPAIQKRLYQKNDTSLKLIANYQLVLNAGYNGQNVYFNINAAYSNLSRYLMNSKMSINDRAISLTLGYRMEKLKKKIFGVL
jgi:hypothetical protein